MLDSSSIEVQQCLYPKFEHSFNFVGSLSVHAKGTILEVYGVLDDQTEHEIPFNKM